MGVDQTKNRINRTPETRSRRQVIRQMPVSRHSLSKGLDLGTKQRQNAEEGILLGECRLKMESRLSHYARWQSRRMRSRMVTPTVTPLKVAAMLLKVPVMPLVMPLKVPVVPLVMPLKVAAIAADNFLFSGRHQRRFRKCGAFFIKAGQRKNTTTSAPNLFVRRNRRSHW
jgi:hypothetical protein